MPASYRGLWKAPGGPEASQGRVMLPLKLALAARHRSSQHECGL